MSGQTLETSNPVVVGGRARLVRQNPTYFVDHPIDVLLIIVRVGADPQSPAAMTNNNIGFEELILDQLGVATGKFETDNTGRMGGGSVANHRPSGCFDSLASVVGHCENAFEYL